MDEQTLNQTNEEVTSSENHEAVLNQDKEQKGTKNQKKQGKKGKNGKKNQENSPGQNTGEELSLQNQDQGLKPPKKQNKQKKKGKNDKNENNNLPKDSDDQNKEKDSDEQNQEEDSNDQNKDYFSAIGIFVQKSEAQDLVELYKKLTPLYLQFKDHSKDQEIMQLISQAL